MESQYSFLYRYFLLNLSPSFPPSLFSFSAYSGLFLCDTYSLYVTLEVLAYWSDDRYVIQIFVSPSPLKNTPQVFAYFAIVGTVVHAWEPSYVVFRCNTYISALLVHN